MLRVTNALDSVDCEVRCPSRYLHLPKPLCGLAMIKGYTLNIAGYSAGKQSLEAVGNGGFRFPGAFTSVETQLPIPNSTVKL